MGYAGETARAAVEDDANEASRSLLSNYSLATPNPAQMRTPAPIDKVMLEAQNNLMLREMQTPLLGSELEPLHEIAGSFDGITPRREIHQTPNVLLQTPRSSSSVISTPLRSIGGSAEATPLRDQLSINRMGVIGETPRLERERQSVMKEDLRRGLMSLPKPKNEYEVALPPGAEEDEAAESTEQAQPKGWVEDAADVEERRRKRRQDEEERRLRLRAQAVQRNLPRPSVVNATPSDSSTAVDALIHAELIAMLQRDASEYPPRGAKPRPNFAEADHFTEDELAQAKSLLDSEFESLKASPNYHVIAYDEFVRISAAAAAGQIFLPKEQNYGKASTASKAEKIASLQNELEINKGILTKESKRAAKIEQKLAVVLGGYQNRSHALHKQLSEIESQVVDASHSKESYRLLAEHEVVATPRRIEDLQREVDFFFRKESELQRKYAALMAERASLL